MSNITTTAVSEGVQPRRRRPLLLWIGGIVGAIVLLAVVALVAMMMRMNYVPADLDTSTTLVTDQGLYRTTYVSKLDPIRVNQIHSWTLHVETANGQPVEDAVIAVDGDMPQHGHGLPTRPQVTQYLGNGDYLVEGLKFHMPGWWIVEFDITADGQSDHVTFNLMLED